ncbi:MAG TPA: MBL fold metallo-hydrolase [Anaerolineales bacterium]|nr:MBL fold metallo-hydrolase [Anaerolineales bacterium]
MQKIGKDIYVESSFPGVTVGAIVTGEGVVLIDAPTHPADAQLWRMRLRELTDQPLRYLILLDHHRDRAMTVSLFGVPVIAHDQTLEQMRTWPEQFKPLLPETGADAEWVNDWGGARLTLPTITFSEQMRLALGGRTLHLFHRPGSAPGATWVEIPDAEAVFLGDAAALKSPPFLAEADLEAWVNVLAECRKKKTAGRVVVPGRGGLTNKLALKPAEDFLKLVRRRLDSFSKGKKGRADLDKVAAELVEWFPANADLRDHYLRRLSHGLEAQFDAQILATAQRS